MKSINKYSEQEIKNVKKFFEKDQAHRPWVKEFEDMFGEVFGTSYNISCANGTAALHAAVAACDVGPGDEVIVPAISVIMDPWSVIACGATPVFADVDEKSHLITLETIKKKVTDKTKAIITISWDGLPCDMDPIMEFAEQNNIYVIDDSARSVLSYYKGKISGTLAHLNTFSFELKKHLTTGGEGGMISSNNEELALKARRFAGIGYKHFSANQGRTNLALSDVQNPEYKRFGYFGLNYRMNDISAAIGMAQLDRINEITDWRKYCGRVFLDAVKEFGWIVPQAAEYDYVHSYYTFSFLNYCEEKFNVTWKEFYNGYVKAGGDGFYSCVAVPFTEPAFNDFLKHGPKHQISGCDVAVEIQKKIMCFKTNYRNIDDLNKNAVLLNKICREIENGTFKPAK